MTKRRSSFLFLRAGLVCLLLAGMCFGGGPGRAEEQKPQRTDCPNIYGTWRVSHVINMKFGGAHLLEEITPWPDMLVKAQFSKTKAVLIFHGNKSALYKKDAGKWEDDEFGGRSSGGHQLKAFVSDDLPDSYPHDKCYLNLIDIEPQDRWNSYLLEKLE